MCLICVDFQRQKMTAFEARRGLGEMGEVIGPEHAAEVEQLLRDAEKAQSREEQPRDDAQE